MPDTTTIVQQMKQRKHNKPISETTTTTAKQTQPNETRKAAKQHKSSSSQTKKKNSNFATTTLRSLGGCNSAAEKVAVPEAIVTKNSADIKTKTKKKMKSNGFEVQDDSFGRNSAVIDRNSVPDDVWRDPRVGEVEVVTGRHVGGRVKISQRERPCSVRRTVSPETISFLDSDAAFDTTCTEQEVLGTKYYRQTRHPSHEDYAEIMMLQRGRIRGNRLDMPDRYSAWRLDVDNMSYEELLELGDRIGYVNTGLKEDEISRCLRKFKLSTLFSLSRNLPMQSDRKCSICQEEYEDDDEIGKLSCGHGYHTQCIKQWLAQRNACPVCKNAPVAR